MGRLFAPFLLLLSSLLFLAESCYLNVSMYDKKLESLIDAALIDGNLTEKEKDILSKKAKALKLILFQGKNIIGFMGFRLK